METINVVRQSNPSRSLFGKLYYYLSDACIEYGDQRVTRGQYFLTSNGFINCFLIISAYLTFVKIIGPKFMKNRPAYELKNLMLFHNTIMTVLNVISFYKSLELLNWGLDLFDFNCPDPNDHSEHALNLIYYGHQYLITKFLDLMDTVYMVLRKKDEQLTFLHLYHHSVVPILGCACFIIYPTATPIGTFIVLNSMVHIVMYSYYGLASFGPEVRKYLWWKKYITQIQIIQFLAYIIYCGFFLMFQKGYNVGFFLIGASQAPLFMFLFYRFYMRSYQRKQMPHKQD